MRISDWSSDVCSSVLARRQGVQIVQGRKVLDATITDGRITEVQTDDGIYTAETVVLAAGMWSRELGRKLGVNLPACAVEHQYLVTEPIPGIPANLPTLRDPDRLVYYKQDAGERLVIGGYEDDTVPFGDRGIPGEFARQLLPENLDRKSPR